MNRFVSTYCPGSTFKAITGAIALDSKTITAETTFEKTDKWQKDSSWGKNYVTTTQSYAEPSNLKNAYIYSDNIFFAQVADKIGAETYTCLLYTSRIAGSDLRNCFFLTQMQLNTAIGDSLTRLPNHLHIPAHWNTVS